MSSAYKELDSIPRPQVILNCTGAKTSSFVNLYMDSCVEELKFIEIPLKSLLLKMNDLISLYPNHPILIQIIRICDRILKFPLNSPLMKILSGLEFVLKKSEEWEAYAAKHVSIRKELDSLSSLVCRWRKLELKSWCTMLEHREQILSKRASRS